MREVELNMTEDLKYNVIKKLVETNGNNRRAALKLGCTRRTINRMVKGYREEGKAFFKKIIHSAVLKWEKELRP